MRPRRTRPVLTVKDLVPRVQVFMRLTVSRPGIKGRSTRAEAVIGRGVSGAAAGKHLCRNVHSCRSMSDRQERSTETKHAFGTVG